VADLLILGSNPVPRVGQFAIRLIEGFLRVRPALRDRGLQFRAFSMPLAASAREPGALKGAPHEAPVSDEEGIRGKVLGRRLSGPGRSERIRTSGPCVPNTVLYQAELHSGQRHAVARASEAGV
jgi:hypothetical protein